MALVVPNVGEALMLANIVNKTAPSNLELRLYTLPSTAPGESAVLGDFTEVSGNGYAAITLTGASWAAAVLGDPSYIAYAKQTFAFTGAAGDIYGYYITRASNTELLYFEEFTGAPYAIVNNGDKIEITPRIELS